MTGRRSHGRLSALNGVVHQGTRTQFFWWKPGRYEIIFRPAAQKGFSIKQPRYSFELMPGDVDRLRQNLASLRRDLEDTIQTNLPEFRREVLTWNWAYPNLKKS